MCDAGHRPGRDTGCGAHVTGAAPHCGGALRCREDGDIESLREWAEQASGAGYEAVAFDSAVTQWPAVRVGGMPPLLTAGQLVLMRARLPRAGFCTRMNSAFSASWRNPRRWLVAPRRLLACEVP